MEHANITPQSKSTLSHLETSAAAGTVLYTYLCYGTAISSVWFEVRVSGFSKYKKKTWNQQFGLELSKVGLSEKSQEWWSKTSYMVQTLKVIYRLMLRRVKQIF